MRYEFGIGRDGVNVEDDIGEIDTCDYPYDELWEFLKLGQDEVEVANKIINFYKASDSSDYRILIITPHSLMGPYNKNRQRHQADHYQTRSRLEAISETPELVERLIEIGLLELHSKWGFLRKRDGAGKLYTQPHPQAPYRLSPDFLFDTYPRLEEIAEDRELREFSEEQIPGPSPFEQLSWDDMP